MQDKAKNNFLKRIISGFFIGLGAILPGVSGGILALSLGIYRDMINAVSSFFKHMKINFLFLLPIAIGAGLGVLSASFAVEWLMNNWFIPVMFIFSGFVLGGVFPPLSKMEQNKALNGNISYAQFWEQRS